MDKTAKFLVNYIETLNKSIDWANQEIEAVNNKLNVLQSKVDTLTDIKLDIRRILDEMGYKLMPSVYVEKVEGEERAKNRLNEFEETFLNGVKEELSGNVLHS